MIQLDCPICKETYYIACRGEITVRGTITCRKDQHERSFVMDGARLLDHGSFGKLQQLDTALPSDESEKLAASVPQGVREDIQEAGRAQYAHCYNASVAMCRRALQLALVEKGVQDGPLGKMMQQAVDSGLMEQNTLNLAFSTKGYGDIGVHRRCSLEPREVGLVIYMTVRMLNELFVPEP